MAKAMSGKSFTPPSAESLAEAAKKAQGKGLPPVHQWSPAFTGDIDMVIARDGTWYYQGSRIKRPALVALFSTILRKEGDRYFLVTPTEKVGLTVEDVPFVAVDVTAEGTVPDQHLIFDTNVGDRVVAGADNAIRILLDAETGEPSPYVHIRAGLEARIDRKSYYRLVGMGCHRNGWFGLWSDGEFFRVIPSEEMSEK